MQLDRVVYLLAQIADPDADIRPETRERLRDELHPNRPYLAIRRFLFREPNRYRRIVEAARGRLPEIDTWLAEWI
jgi:hypothetical protein